jgi:hypothetical protein
VRDCNEATALVWRYLRITLPHARWWGSGVMGSRELFALAFLTALSSTGLAAGNDKGSGLTSYQLGDYSLGLDTDDPNKPDPAAPPGLATLRQDTIRPFVGLKLSTPLTTHFWNFKQGPQEPSRPKKKPTASGKKSVKRKRAAQDSGH